MFQIPGFISKTQVSSAGPAGGESQQERRPWLMTSEGLWKDGLWPGGWLHPVLRQALLPCHCLAGPGESVTQAGGGLRGVRMSQTGWPVLHAAKKSRRPNGGLEFESCLCHFCDFEQRLTAAERQGPGLHQGVLAGRASLLRVVGRVPWPRHTRRAAG